MEAEEFPYSAKGRAADVAVACGIGFFVGIPVAVVYPAFGPVVGGILETYALLSLILSVAVLVPFAVLRWGSRIVIDGLGMVAFRWGARTIWKVRWEETEELFLYSGDALVWRSAARQLRLRARYLKMSRLSGLCVQATRGVVRKKIDGRVTSEGRVTFRRLESRSITHLLYGALTVALAAYTLFIGKTLLQGGWRRLSIESVLGISVWAFFLWIVRVFAARRSQRVDVDRHGIEVSQVNKRVRISWEELSGVRPHSEGFMIVPNTGTPLLILREVANVEVLQELLSEHTTAR